MVDGGVKKRDEGVEMVVMGGRGCRDGGRGCRDGGVEKVEKVVKVIQGETPRKEKGI